MTHSILFFGSFQKYSVQVLEKVYNSGFKIHGVVTTPPRYQGRHLTLTKNPVHIFAESHRIPFFTPESLDASQISYLKSQISNPDFLVVAGYGKLLPPEWLAYSKIMSVNMHPSLLPKYRGTTPAEWAILNGEKETGVSLIKMSPEFDKGEILTQKKLEILAADTTESLYQKLFDLGAELLIESLPNLGSDLKNQARTPVVPSPQTGSPSYARKFTREDGFIPWETLLLATEGKTPSLNKLPPLIGEIMHKSRLDIGHWTLMITRMLRAFGAWPGMWTTQPNGKRLKILKAHLDDEKLVVDLVQEEGERPKPPAWQIPNHPPSLKLQRASKSSKS